MTWWHDEIQQLREENEQLRQQLANQPCCMQLIAQYLKEKEVKEESVTVINNRPSIYAELLQFKAWVEQRAASSRNRILQ
jgi:hypothetical protein